MAKRDASRLSVIWDALREVPLGALAGTGHRGRLAIRPHGSDECWQSQSQVSLTACRVSVRFQAEM